MKNQRVFWLLLVVVVTVLNSARAEVKQSYFVKGGKLKLGPSVSPPITSILWKHKGDLLAEWIKDNVNLTYYGDYNGRTTLDIKTGHLEISNMDETKDSGSYTLEINNKVHGQSYDAIPIEEVPKPNVWIRPLTCDGQQANCTLFCDGDTAKAEPVDYSWKKDGKVWDGVDKKEVEIFKTKTELVKTFSCSMKNPVSEKESKPKDNPFFKESSSGNPGGVAAGVTIFLVALALAALGVWQRKRIKGIFSPSDSGNAVNSASPSKTENPNPPATEGLMANKEEDGKPDATDPV